MSQQIDAEIRRKIEDMREALLLALDLLKADRAICERSFLPEPDVTEQQILTNYTTAIDKAESIIAEVDLWMPRK
jgi:hypothetical protein